MYICIHILKYLRSHKIKKTNLCLINHFSPFFFLRPYSPFLEVTLIKHCMWLSVSQSYPFVLAVVVQASSGPSTCIPFSEDFFWSPASLLTQVFAWFLCRKEVLGITFLDPQTVSNIWWCTNAPGLSHFVHCVLHRLPAFPWEINPYSSPIVAGLKR